jgi:hypothetical protein
MQKFALEIITAVVCFSIIYYLNLHKSAIKGEDLVLDHLMKIQGLLERLKGKLLHQAMVIIPLRREKFLLRKECETKAAKWVMVVIACCLGMILLTENLPESITKSSVFQAFSILVFFAFCIAGLAYTYQRVRRFLHGLAMILYTVWLYVLYALVFAVEKPVDGIRWVYSVHVRTRKYRNLAKTKRYVVPAPRANSKTQGGTRIDSDSICHRHHSVFSGFQTV